MNKSKKVPVETSLHASTGTFNAIDHRIARSPFCSHYETDSTEFGIYNHRLYPWSLGDDTTKAYWRLRKQVMMYDVPETPIEIKGPHADRLLNKVFTRDVTRLKNDRAGYAIACFPDGGIMMDGVLIKLEHYMYWYVQADGEFFDWLIAHSIGLDVQISDPNS